MSLTNPIESLEIDFIFRFLPSTGQCDTYGGQAMRNIIVLKEKKQPSRQVSVSGPE